MELDAILTHEHTDFDAIASQLGAHKLYPSYVPILPRRVNKNVQDFLALHRDVLPFKRIDELPPNTRFVNVILVETQTLPSIKGVRRETLRSVRVIDHHEKRADFPPDWHFEGQLTGACTTLLVQKIAERRIALTPVEATLLLLGIYEDTGALTYAGTTPLDLRAAAWLLEQGANLDVVRNFLDHPLTESQRRLYRQLLQNIESFEINGYTVVIAATAFDEYVDEVSTLSHFIRELHDPAALFVVVKMGDHVQIVARSTTDDIHVGRIMAQFGGGGHARAAAAFVDNQSLEDVVERLRTLLPDFVEPAYRVRDIMSRGRIRTIHPNTTIREAHEQMVRWGHEGFPVVDASGLVVGVLTRRDVDRALHHHMGKQPVSAVMHKGPIFVAPDESVERVQRIMTEYNVGQVPVLENGRIVGIVTRTDLLKLWQRSEEQPYSREEIARRLEEAIPSAILQLVRAIAREANQMGYSLYFVGGFVRDLLLGQPLKDLDLVVEGDAIRLAHRLAEKYGGRVVAHKRFGTAKWILREGERPASSLIGDPTLPPHLDLVTARTEFYEEPTALPTVEESNIKLDLHRRDFTINTLAIALDESRYGQLLDFYGGVRDLREKRIRVLHNLSLVEDPTRILRAVRFEQRLGFEIEPRTLELIRDSLELLGRVSGDRLRHELALILQEERAEQMLARLHALGALQAIDPALTFDDAAAERMRRLREAGITDFWALLAAWLWSLPWENVERIATRLSLAGRDIRKLQALWGVKAQAAALAAAERASQAVHVIEAHTTDERVLRVAWHLLDEPRVRERLHRYLHEWRHVRPRISGSRLREMGLPPGPHYAQLLAQVRNALLDGEVQSEAEEAALLERLARAWQQEHQQPPAS
nr:CBS domain-containing protein [Ardenticatena sp.]